MIVTNIAKETLARSYNKDICLFLKSEEGDLIKIKNVMKSRVLRIIK
jgi:hypothetical protein